MFITEISLLIFCPPIPPFHTMKIINLRFFTFYNKHSIEFCGYLRSDPLSTVAPQPTVVHMAPVFGSFLNSTPAVLSEGRQIGRTCRLYLIGADNFIRAEIISLNTGALAYLVRLDLPISLRKFSLSYSS